MANTEDYGLFEAAEQIANLLDLVGILVQNYGGKLQDYEAYVDASDWLEGYQDNLGCPSNPDEDT